MIVIYTGMLWQKFSDRTRRLIQKAGFETWYLLCQVQSLPFDEHYFICERLWFPSLSGAVRGVYCSPRMQTNIRNTVSQEFEKFIPYVDHSLYK